MPLSYEDFCIHVLPKLSKQNDGSAYSDWYCNLCELYIRDWRNNIRIVNQSYGVYTYLGDPYQKTWYQHYLKIIAHPLAKPSTIFTHRPASL